MIHILIPFLWFLMGLILRGKNCQKSRIENAKEFTCEIRKAPCIICNKEYFGKNSIKYNKGGKNWEKSRVENAK